MRRNRFLPCGIAIIVACCVLTGCSRGPSEEELAQARFQERAAMLEQQYQELRNIRAELAAAEAELAEIEAISERDRSDEQKAALETLPARIDELTSARDEAFDATQAALAEFLNVALNEFPENPNTVTGLNIYSDEAILIAEDAVQQAGDYRKAVEQLSSALSYYDTLGLEPYQPLVEKLEEFTDMRFIDEERFEAVKNGMTKDEVKAVAGVPYYQNIQVDEKRGVETWLYRKDDGGAAAIYFRIKSDKVYSKNFEAVKTKVVD